MEENQSQAKQKTLEVNTVWRSDNLLVLSRGCTLPKRCPFCNGEGLDPPVKMAVSDDSVRKRMPRGAVLAVFGVLFGALGGLVGGLLTSNMQGKVRVWHVDVHLCRAHQDARKRFNLALIGLFGASVVAAVLVGILVSVAMAMLVVFGALMVIVIYALVGQKRFVYKKNDYGRVFVKGPCSAFLDTLPDYR